MAFTDSERTANHAALKWFLDKKRPPENMRDKLDMGYSIVGHTVDIFEVRPDWKDKSSTRHTPVARAKFIRTRGLWCLYWRRSDLKWHLYEPASEHPSLQRALSVVAEDEYCCFFG